MKSMVSRSWPHERHGRTYIAMGFIPKGARWYRADVVLEYVIENERRNLVHVNTHLVEAASPEEAYKKGGKLGRMHQHR